MNAVESERALVGHGWQALIEELRERLRAVDAQARWSPPAVDEHGLLRLRVRSSSPQRQAEVEALLNEFRERVLMTCELCGEGGRVYAGPVLSIRCRSCLPP